MDVNQYILDKYNLEPGHIVLIPGFVRKDLYSLFNELGYKTGCEIGVQSGRNALRMVQQIPDLKLYLVDPYKNHPFTTRKWKENDFVRYERMARNRFTDNPNVQFIKDYSESAVRLFKKDGLDFVYIDGEHSYNFVMIDLIFWHRKVRSGGIVSGHDYFYRNRNAGPEKRVMGAVHDYIKVHNLYPLFLTDKSVKTDDKQDTATSWFWVVK